MTALTVFVPELQVRKQTQGVKVQGPGLAGHRGCRVDHGQAKAVLDFSGR